MSGKIAAVFVVFALVGCQTADRHHSSQTLAANSLFQDFCKAHGVSQDSTLPELWSDETVQHKIDELIHQTKIQGTPWMAYPVAYKKMTYARDKERCGGVLKSKNQLHARINDLLSDIMTRFYVATADACAASDAKLGKKHGFCPLMARMRKERFDALSAAMASTGLYLSSHITLSLSAVILADDFWEQSGLPETQRASADWQSVVKARIEHVRLYKPLFDKFNLFLADNITTVASALSEEGLIEGDVLRFISGVTKYLPFRALPFGKIRDDAFNLALELSLTIDPASHPMMISRNNWNRINFGRPNFDFTYPPKLSQLEESGIEFAASRENMLIYHLVLGGKSWDEVTKKKPQ